MAGEIHDLPGIVQVLHSVLGRRATKFVVYVALGVGGVLAIPPVFNSVDYITD